MKATMMVLLVVLMMLVAGPADAGGKNQCDSGDESLGPNCIHVTMRKSPRQELAVSKVYRVSKRGKKTIVWSGQGFVTESTEKKLIVRERSYEDAYGEGEYEYRYDWNGKIYTGRKLCPLGKTC